MTVLCGGVGGARTALALCENLPVGDLTFLVNTGDDFSHLGLEIWPDWDSVIYTLAGLNDATRGWGRADEGTRAMEELARLEAPSWFHLGDRDLALHVYRQWALSQGEGRAEVAAHIAARLGVHATVLRVSEHSLRTRFVLVDGETMDFQSWFVRHQGKPKVARVEVPGAAEAVLTAGVLQAVLDCDLLLLAPSNPYLSTFPILEIPAITQALRERSGPTWAVSPLLGGRAVKGHLDTLLSQLSPSAGQQAIVDLYAGWASQLLLPGDEMGGLTAPPGMTLRACRTWLSTPERRAEFVKDLLA